MRIVRFNGLGRAPGIETGHVLVLVQGDAVSVVKVEIVGPDDHGPVLTHALNESELVDELRSALRQAFPTGLSDEQHWLVECPTSIVARARFPG
ncbi:MAG: hypothetical protein H0T79_06235 [Deltaproteobacteria bacterium]|nr:hypothetical protein [Deltaproteobacteria bacterium]